MGMLTKEDRARGLREPGGNDEQPFMAWHDPKTGKTFPRLPSDGPNAKNYIIRGFHMGKAPPRLRKKWKASEAKRKAAADKMEARLRTGPHGAAIKAAEQKAQGGGQAASVSEVAAEVIRQLQELGIVPATAAKTDDGPEDPTDGAGQPAQD